MALKMYGVCVLCALPLASMGEFTVLPHTLWLGACPEETFIAAARGSSMTLGSPHLYMMCKCTCRYVSPW